ncbi:MAG TPA: DNA-3-methyladenine glycosylase [Methylomirabilota bacterium]|nr:DNA-3-methyladenine glycosylase [Methylomirabilota bacterium]
MQSTRVTKQAEIRVEDLKPLPRSFYEPSAKVVAPKLIGHYLIRRTESGFAGGPIVETEAYVENDPACHAFCGPTKRNQVMFGEPGYAYVYLIYGFYYCFNAVCKPPGKGEAVLVRAIEPVFGVEYMRGNREVDDERNLTSGPGKLCKALEIERGLDGVDLTDATSELFVCENPDLKGWWKTHGPMVTTTRIGLTKAADWPLRWYAEKHPHVSKRAKRPMAEKTLKPNS